MPLVLVAKARERARAPAPPDVYAPAARNVRPFARAFSAAMRSAVPSAAHVELVRRAAAREPSSTADHILAAIPWLDADVPDSPPVAEAWSPAPLTAAYLRVLEDSGEIEKRRGRVTTVRVNPRSIEWAKERGSKLIRSVSAQTKETVRNIVARHLERGERAETMAAAIKRSVGLLPRDEAAVDRRRSQLLAQEIPGAQAERLSDKYAAELLEARAIRIARTETIAAQNRGLLDTWQEAADSGSLPDTVMRVWVAAPPSDNPNRPCPICLELDGLEAPLDEPFESALLEEQVVTPPAHPNCRCTMTLRRGEG